MIAAFAPSNMLPIFSQHASLHRRESVVGGDQPSASRMAANRYRSTQQPASLRSNETYPDRFRTGGGREDGYIVTPQLPGLWLRE